MPVPKDKEEIYGRIVGHNINTGHNLEQAKNIADAAIKHKGVNDKSLKHNKCKACGKVHGKDGAYH